MALSACRAALRLLILLGITARYAESAEAAAEGAARSKWRPLGDDEQLESGPSSDEDKLHAELNSAAAVATQALHSLQADIGGFDVVVNATAPPKEYMLRAARDLEESNNAALAHLAKQGNQQRGSGAAAVDAQGHTVVSGSAALAQTRENLTMDAHLSEHSRLARWAPLSPFLVDHTDRWSQWPGMEKQFSLVAPCTVLINYAVLIPGGNMHTFSKLEVDGVEHPMARSVAGNRIYSQNAGYFVEFLEAGSHVVRVLYRSKAEVSFPDGGDEIYQRSLNILSLPEASALIRNPMWTHRFSESNLWWHYPGFEQEIYVDQDMPLFVIYNVAIATRQDFLATKLFIDHVEQKTSRSVWGETTYGQNTGFWVGHVQQGKRVIQIKYRTPSKSIYFNNFAGKDMQTRSLLMLWLPEAEFITAFDDSELTLVGNKWTVWPGLDKEFVTYTDRYVIITYQVAIPIKGENDLYYGHLMSHVIIDGQEQPQTRSICGEQTYCTVNGMWTGVLPAGRHRVQVMYKTASDGLVVPAGYHDFGTKVLNIITLKRIKDLAPEMVEQHGPGGKDMSFQELDASLTQLRDLEGSLRQMPTTSTEAPVLQATV